MFGSSDFGDKSSSSILEISKLPSFYSGNLSKSPSQTYDY